MKTVYKLMIFPLLLMNCESDTKQESSLKSADIKTSIQEKNNTASKEMKSHNILTEAQFKDFFPKEIGGYKLENVSVLMSSAIASAMYLKDKDYAHTMTYNLEDCNRKGAANIMNFEDGYKRQGQCAPGTETVYKVRDGHKTIAFLQHNIKRYNIHFVFNNRFNIVLEGPEHPDVLWSYIDFEKLKTFR